VSAESKGAAYVSDPMPANLKICSDEKAAPARASLVFSTSTEDSGIIRCSITGTGGSTASRSKLAASPHGVIRQGFSRRCAICDAASRHFRKLSAHSRTICESRVYAVRRRFRIGACRQHTKQSRKLVDGQGVVLHRVQRAP